MLQPSRVHERASEHTTADTRGQGDSPTPRSPGRTRSASRGECGRPRVCACFPFWGCSALWVVSCSLTRGGKREKAPLSIAALVALIESGARGYWLAIRRRRSAFMSETCAALPTGNSSRISRLNFIAFRSAGVAPSLASRMRSSFASSHRPVPQYR